MELALREAKARLSGLVAAANDGERFIATSHGEPAVELVECHGRGGIDFEKLAVARRRIGLTGEGQWWPEKFNDPAFSRLVLGIDD